MLTYFKKSSLDSYWNQHLQHSFLYSKKSVYKTRCYHADWNLQSEYINSFFETLNKEFS